MFFFLNSHIDGFITVGSTELRVAASFFQRMNSVDKLSLSVTYIR